MRLTIPKARELVERVMTALGHDGTDARLIADHLMDCELRGLSYGGLARAISIAERINQHGDHRRPIAIVHETPVSARVPPTAMRWTRSYSPDPSRRHLRIVGEHAGVPGIAGAHHREPARLSLVDRNARGAMGDKVADLIATIHIGTSTIIHAEVTLARRLGNGLPANIAFDRDGLPTRDSAAALAGAFAAWGGHEGSGLAIVVQLLGILAGSPPIPPELAGFGYLIIAMRPDLMGLAETFGENVSTFANAVRSAGPVGDGSTMRMPFDRSRSERSRRLAENAIEVPDVLIDQLTLIASGPPR